MKRFEASLGYRTALRWKRSLRLGSEPDILLAEELASHVAAARLNINAPDIRADDFSIKTAYEIFVVAHLCARTIIRRAEIYSKDAVKHMRTKPNKDTSNGSEKITPVFHAEKENESEQLSF